MSDKILQKNNEKSHKQIIINIPNTSLKIIEENDKIIIHSDKDIFLSSSGNIVSKADNYNVVFGRQIHLNPKISDYHSNKSIIEQVKEIEDENNKGENKND